MTRSEFTKLYSEYLKKDEKTAPMADNWEHIVFESDDPKCNFLTKNGYILFRFFESHYVSVNPGSNACKVFTTYVDFGKHDLEAVRKNMGRAYDTLMYIGKDNCGDKTNFAIVDSSFSTAIDMIGGWENMLNKLQQTSE